MKMPSGPASRMRRLARLVTMVVIAVMPMLSWSPRAFAQIPIGDPAPKRPPAASALEDGLGWLKWIALWAAVAAVLIGATSIAVGHFGGNYQASSVGRRWLLGGLGAAVLAAVAWTLVNTVYGSAS
jgi:hypothetical protein